MSVTSSFTKQVATKESGHQFDKREKATQKLNIVALEKQTLSDIPLGA